MEDLNQGWELLLIYLAFIPLSIFLLYIIILHLGYGLLMPVLGASLTVGSLVVHKYFPRGDRMMESSLAVASAAVWLFELIGSFCYAPDYSPLFVLLFFTSMVIVWYIRS